MRFDVVPGVAHEPMRVLEPVKDFFASILGESMKRLITLAVVSVLTTGCAVGEGRRRSARFRASRCRSSRRAVPAAAGTRGPGASPTRSASARSPTQKATVTNVPGAGGTIGLAQFAKKQGDPYQLMVMDSVTMLGGIVNNKSPVDLSTLTPVAGLSRGPSAIVVPKKSPYKELKALLATLKPSRTASSGRAARSADPAR